MKEEMAGYEQFDGQWQDHARLAWDTVNMRPTRGIASRGLNVMDWGLLEEIGGHAPGSYPKDPVRVYLDFERAIGCTMIDQWIPENPLTMTDQGYRDDTKREATTGATQIVRDGMLIDSPEAVVAHMEAILFPQLIAQAKELAANTTRLPKLIADEVKIQRLFGLNMLKGPYSGFFMFPTFRYGAYGYENYFMAYALYPEVMERCFRLHGDVAEKFNAISARAIVEGLLPRLLRLDHDMADSRGTLVDVRSLDRLWMPHFVRAIKPLLDAGIRLIWHCDGNLMDMVPRLLEVGLGGFQGFQYEDGMDYERICKMKTRDGGDLLIIAGVSVTRALPHGTRDDVVKQLRWLVEKGPKVGLFLGASSSVAPRTNRGNVKTLIEGLAHYRKHGRSGGG